MDFLVILTIAYRDGSRMCYADLREVITVETGQETSNILQTAHDKILASENVPDNIRPQDCSIAHWSITPNILNPKPTNRQMNRK